MPSGSDNLVLQASGQGHTLLCLHGIGGCAEWFKGLSIRLQDRFRVVALDLPGTGANRVEGEAFSVERCAEILAAYILEHEAEPISILGHSLGTILALRLAASVPAKLRSFIFVGGMPKITDSIRQRLTERRAVILKSGMGGLGWKVAMGNFSRSSLNGNPECAALFARLWESQSQSIYLEEIESLMAVSAESLVRHAELPCLVLRGSEDGYAPREESLRLAASLPGPARFLELENCAHMPFLENPPAFSAAVLEFLTATG
ncbi:MAG: alpha/beta hydrolase [Fibrobacteria bacterium]